MVNQSRGTAGAAVRVTATAVVPATLTVAAIPAAIPTHPVAATLAATAIPAADATPAVAASAMELSSATVLPVDGIHPAGIMFPALDPIAMDVLPFAADVIPVPRLSPVPSQFTMDTLSFCQATMWKLLR